MGLGGVLLEDGGFGVQEQLHDATVPLARRGEHLGDGMAWRGIAWYGVVRGGVVLWGVMLHHAIWCDLV